MKQTLNHYLTLLKEYDPLTEEQHASIEARVRRDVIARYGSFTMPARPVVHTPELVRGGMLIFLRGMVRPALAFAALGVLIVGVAAVMRQLDGGVLPPLTFAPVASSEAVVASAPITPGSGVALSVFGVAAPSVQPQAPSRKPAASRSVRPKPLTPAEGVFTQWGTSVFSEEGRLQSDWEGKSVFNS